MYENQTRPSILSCCPELYQANVYIFLLKPRSDWRVLGVCFSNLRGFLSLKGCCTQFERTFIDLDRLCLCRNNSRPTLGTRRRRSIHHQQPQGSHIILCRIYSAQLQMKRINGYQFKIEALIKTEKISSLVLPKKKENEKK